MQNAGEDEKLAATVSILQILIDESQPWIKVHFQHEMKLNMGMFPGQKPVAVHRLDDYKQLSVQLLIT